MRYSSLLALAAAIALTAGLVVVLGAQSVEEMTATGDLEPPRYVMALVEASSDTTTTSTMVVVLDEIIGLHPAEEELINEVLGVTVDLNTTTTTTAPKATATKNPVSPRPTTTTTTTPSAPSTTAAQPAGGSNSAFESDFYGRINSYRSANGLATLSRQGDLDSLARGWAKYMGTNGVLQHSSNPSKIVPPWAAAGETVGRGSSVSSLWEAFKSSSGHRSIILGDFTHVGVGVWVDAEGTIWTAHLFGRA